MGLLINSQLAFEEREEIRKRNEEDAQSKLNAEIVEFVKAELQKLGIDISGCGARGGNVIVDGITFTADVSWNKPQRLKQVSVCDVCDKMFTQSVMELPDIYENTLNKANGGGHYPYQCKQPEPGPLTYGEQLEELIRAIAAGE